MNNLITAHDFDAWVSRQYGKLRQRLMVTCIFDDDAFQETYLAMREIVDGQRDKDFPAMFMKLYRQMLSREYRSENRYLHPDPLFFEYLRTEPVVFFDEPADGEDTQEATERTAKNIKRLCKATLNADDYQIFYLHFICLFTFKEMRAYTGKSFSTLNRRLKFIKSNINKEITPPYCSCFAQAQGGYSYR